MNVIKQLHSSVKQPTSIIVKGANLLGVEIARSLVEQGGFVIIIDSESNSSRKLLEPLAQYKNLAVLDFSAIANLSHDLRRLDYVFYFEHKSTELSQKISTQKFLQNSNYLDSMLDLTAKFDAKFLLTSSVRAHQLNISNAQVDYNYGLESGKTRHAQYIELEIQRYAESLVEEYQEKVGINARIVRMGEILGRGIEFDQSSSLIRLIKSGLDGDDLVVHGDGLEASYYIHYLDAAYGILKAQFSASGKGRIFTLANPEEVTILSIAYKLLELLPNAREIRFDEKDEYSPLVLYKPAENLTQIGWKPRINFDRALVQTIEYIQELLVIEKALTENKSLQLNDSKNMSDKIRDFFFVAENEAVEGDAISKLIAERKKLEMTRTGSMVRANSDLKEKNKKKTHLNPLERFDLLLHDTLFGFSRKISFLKNITVTDLIVTLFLVVGFAVIYFVLISPLFSLSRNIFSTGIYFDRVTQDVKSLNFKQAGENNRELTDNLTSAQDRVEDLQYLFSIVGKEQEYSDTQRFLENAIGYSESYSDLFEAYEPMQDYLDNVDLGISYRFGENKLLSVEQQGEFEDVLNRMFLQRGSVNDGINRVRKAKQETDIYAAKLPKRFQELLKADRGELDAEFAKYSYLADYYTYWPILLGRENPISYLLVIQDNTRYTPSGGQIVGFINFSIENGVLRSIDASTVTDLTIPAEAITDRAISEINLVSVKEANKENIVFGDLGSISDQQVFLQNLKTVYEQTNETKIDMVISADLSTLSSMLQNTGSVEYQQISFEQNNLLNNINLLTDEENQELERNQVIMNLLAKTLAERFSRLDTTFADLATVMAAGKANKEMNYFSNNVNLENFIRATNGVTFVPTEEIAFGMSSTAKIEKQLSKYPITTVSGEITVNADYTTVKSLDLALNSADNLESSFLCVSGGARNLANNGVGAELVSTTFGENKVCNIFLKDDDLVYGLDYETTAFAEAGAKQAVYMLRLTKTPGIESNFDLEFNFANSFSVIAEDQNYIKQDNKYIYSGVLTNDKIFRFELLKQ